MQLVGPKILQLCSLFVVGACLVMSGVMARECLLGGTWPDLQRHVAVFTRGLTRGYGSQDLGIPPGALSPVSASGPALQREPLATEVTLPADPVQSPVDALDTQVITTLVTRVPVLATVDHIATHLGTALQHNMVMGKVFWCRKPTRPVSEHMKLCFPILRSQSLSLALQ